MLGQCPALNASFGSPASEDEWITYLRSPDRALQHQAVQKAQKVAGELRLPVPTWAEPQGRPPMAEWSKAPDLSSGPRKRAWVRTPLLTMCVADNPPGAACTLRGKGFFNDRGVLHAEASRRRRDQKFALLGARRRIAVANEAPAETPDDGEDDASPTTRRLRHWKAQKQLLKVGAPKQRAPFRPPSRDPSPLPAPPEYASFRQRHLRYYDSIRHTVIICRARQDLIRLHIAG
ncbi:hypothetical protein HPB50_029443 [Hyalomma asiaticum]|nr:hypothetical protein HPB50_029443 [Hyalomma asiaticum]